MNNLILSNSTDQSHDEQGAEEIEKASNITLKRNRIAPRRFDTLLAVPLLANLVPSQEDLNLDL